MRPEKLFPLFADISVLKGVGVKTKQLIAKLAGDKVVSLVYHLPSSVIDRRNMPAITDMESGQIVTSIVQIEEHIPPFRPHDKSSPYKIRCYNETGFLTLVFFAAYPDYLKKQMPVGEKRVISGKVDSFGGEIQITHPDYIEPLKNLEKVKIVEPVYPLTAGIAKKNLLKIIAQCLAKVCKLDEWIDVDYLAKNNWLSWDKSIKNGHAPQSEDDILAHSKSRMRLAYDELLANQLALQLRRMKQQKEGGESFKGDEILRSKLLESLPFKLTNGQNEVIQQIIDDQQSPYKMTRLLQGDVGSGKTVIALMAALNVVECGKQAAIMAPTEILAMQHYSWISDATKYLDCKVELLIGKVKGKKRQQILDDLKAGEINIIIGTHAIFQETVEFNELALAIIDEQHRFGVQQRNNLAKKGKNSDLLLMTATPIPRTLTLTMYGDMECSKLTEKPMGRREIDTRVLPSSKISNIIDGLQRVLDKGEKAYWICPLIEESEFVDLAAAEERFNVLSKIFPDKIGLVHGKMKSSEREQVMLDFRDGDIDILVATTVVEVGVDVKNATAIIIEHAERFGLSQLHQLRGRVGRNDKQSSCVLLYYALGEVSKERLLIMRESNDGFRLAEEDLRLRGGGDVLGTKQSGMPDFKVADLYEHFQLLKDANEDMRKFIEKDPTLKSDRGRALKILLHLFGYKT